MLSFSLASVNVVPVPSSYIPIVISFLSFVPFSSTIIIILEGSVLQTAYISMYLDLFSMLNLLSSRH